MGNGVGVAVKVDVGVGVTSGVAVAAGVGSTGEPGITSSCPIWRIAFNEIPLAAAISSEET
jgi:hypothetical protein